jgi:nucleoside-diphosphate-sugar epimerase
MKKRKVFILGGGGFIGSAIVRILSSRGNYDITVGDNFIHNQLDEDLKIFYKKNNIRLLHEDFTNPRQLDKLENEYDDFYMLASMIGVNYTLENPHEVIRVNTALIYNSLEWLKKVKLKSVLFTSTSECYSGTIDKFQYKVPTDERIPLCIDDIHHPRWTYAATKILGESGFLNYSKQYGLNCKIIRYNNIIGPKMGFGHVIPHLVERFSKKENPFKIYGADQTRSFCYVDDGALGTIQAMECESASNDIFHIGNDVEISIERFIKTTGSYFNYKGNYEVAPTYPGSVSRRCPDLTKSKNILGFKINYTWEQALFSTLDWYKEYFEKNPDKKCFEAPDKFYTK